MDGPRNLRGGVDLATSFKTRGTLPVKRVGYPQALIHKAAEKSAQPPLSRQGPVLSFNPSASNPRRYAGSPAARASKNITAVKK